VEIISLLAQERTLKKFCTLHENLNSCPMKRIRPGNEHLETLTPANQAQKFKKIWQIYMYSRETMKKIGVKMLCQIVGKDI